MPKATRRSLAAAVALALLVLPLTAAAGVRLRATDARGVTLELTLPAWALSAPGADGRVRVVGVPDAHSLAEPGRALLPAFATTLALPADARPTARVLAASPEESRDGVRLPIAGRPVFTQDLVLGTQPSEDSVTAVVDGAWPPAPVQMTEPYSVRGRRLVAIEVRPFRYDAGALRLSATRTLTIRVDFNRPSTASSLEISAAPDVHADAAFESAVLNWDQAKGWRTAPRAIARRAAGLFSATGTAVPFDEDQAEVRVTLDSTALYLLPYDELAAKGYPAGVPIAQVSVHRHEFLEGQNPPYETIELPSEIEDADNDGIFDTGDGVWVWSRTWAERSNATNIRRFWGDAQIVYVTRKLSGGLRVPTRPGWRGQTGLTVPPSYPFFKHWEANYQPFIQYVGTPIDTNLAMYHWTGQSFYYSRPDTLRIETNDLDNTHAIDFRINWVGTKFNTHFMWAGVRNGAGQFTIAADSIFWSGKTAITASSTLPGTALTEGRTNFLRQWGKTFSSPPDPVTNSLCNANMDWFETTYWRRYSAVRDYMVFNSADATGEIQIHSDRWLTDQIHVYDVTSPENPVRVLLDPAHMSVGATVSFDFQDSVATGGRRNYVAAGVQNPIDPTLGPKIPPSAKFAAVQRRQLYAATAADYVLIVPEAFLPAMQPLVNLRTSQGMNVLVAPMESVSDEFDGGRRTGPAVQRFLKYAYGQWDAKFVLFAGDGTLDPLNVRRTSGRDWIPVLPSPSPVPVGEGYQLVPSDNRYGIITGNPDPFFGFTPVVPDLMVGRLPVNTLAEAAGVVNKIVAYESLAGDDSWRRRGIFYADDAYSGETTFGGGGNTGSNYCHRDYEERFVTLGMKMASIINVDAGLADFGATLFNQRYYEANEPFSVTFGDTCRPDRAATQTRVHATVTPILFSLLNQGQLFWNYQGHANEYVLTHEDIYRNSTGSADDKFLFANDGKPCLFTAFSCHANMFAQPEVQLGAVGPSLGEDMVNLPVRGALASWASVSYEVVPRDDSSHVNVELIRSMFADPPRDPIPGVSESGSRVVLGEVILTTFINYVPTVQSYAFERGIAITYTLLGDPASRMSIGRPRSYVTANDLPVIDGQPVRLHTLGDTLTLVADLVSTVRLDSIGLYRDTGSGDFPIPSTDYTLTPDFPDTASGGIYGGRRFRLVYRTTLEARSYSYTIIARDRDGLVQRFNVVFQLDGVLRVNGVPINDNDEVAPNAIMSMSILSPLPITDPASQLQLKINGVPQAFVADTVAGDPSHRELVLRWTHADYAIDTYIVELTFPGGATIVRTFRVTGSSTALNVRDLIPFPNPFDNDGTRFSFQLMGSEPADVKITVFTKSGRAIYSTVVRDLSPGYHQLPWDGRDAEGSEIANGLYFFRLAAATPGGAHVQELGRLVKLRRPRHIDEPVPTP